MSEIYEYLRANNGTIHLALFVPNANTLCGREPYEMTPLDETTSGRLATCGSCRRLLQLNEKADQEWSKRKAEQQGPVADVMSLTGGTQSESIADRVDWEIGAASGTFLLRHDETRCDLSFEKLPVEIALVLLRTLKSYLSDT